MHWILLITINYKANYHWFSFRFIKTLCVWQFFIRKADNTECFSQCYDLWVTIITLFWHWISKYVYIINYYWVRFAHIMLYDIGCLLRFFTDIYWLKWKPSRCQNIEVWLIISKRWYVWWCQFYKELKCDVFFENRWHTSTHSNSQLLTLSGVAVSLILKVNEVAFFYSILYAITCIYLHHIHCWLCWGIAPLI